MRKVITLLSFIFFLSSFFGKAQILHPEQHKARFNRQKGGNINLYYDKQLNKYDIHFVKLDIEVSNVSTYISGNASIHAKSVLELDTFILELHNSMNVDSLFIDDIKVNFKHSGNQIEYIFETPLSENESFKADVFYKGTPYAYGGGVTNKYDSNWGKNVTWTLSESFHAYEWWPCKQVLSDKIDSTHIFLTCADDCMAGSNGLLTNVVDLPNNKKRYEWKSNYPINYYLISFAVAEYQDYSIYAEPEGADPILIQNFIYNTSSCLNYYKSDIDKTAEQIELFSEKFGLYPFANEKYGHCLTNLGGGMEHQTMTTIGNFGYTLVAHELGHMWFGDYVTCATWQDIWINEGFASYTEYVALENLVSKSSANNWIKDAQNRALSEPYGTLYIPFEDAANESRIFSYALSYKKGAAILHVLRHQINNDDLFFAAIRTYLDQYKNDVATGDDFKEVMEQETGLDLDAFFDQWYYGYGYPQFNIEFSQVNDTLTLRVGQETSSTKTPLFQLYVDYKVEYENGDTTLRLYQSESSEEFRISTKGKVVKNLIVDPDGWILKETGSITRTSFPTNKVSFNVFPNPVTEQLHISFVSTAANQEKQIRIYDLNGRVILLEKTIEKYKPIDVSKLAKGIYFIKVTSNGKSYSERFLKQ